MSDLDKYDDLINHNSDDSKDEISDFLNKSADAQLPVSRNKEAIWEKISASIDEENQNNGKSRAIFWKLSGIAASIAIIVTLSVFFFKNDQLKEIQVITQNGENLIEILPDGSTVRLNSSSSISYMEDWNREISLDGEAFFEVAEGEKFVVKTSMGNVQVLGTSFNVFVRDGDFEVACKTGIVQVSIPVKSYEEQIVPGQMISLKADTVRKIVRLPELMGKWQAGEFYFDGPISEVFKEMQRQFGVEIEFKGLEEQTFSGYFTNRDLENALDQVCLPSGLEYRKTGEDIFAISRSTQ